MTIAPCHGCPLQSWTAAPARVVHRGNGKWDRAADDADVHLAALFRDPQVQAGRQIEIVLDLPADRSACRAGAWLQRFTTALAALPIGLVVAIDNGVRCPCGTALGPKAYEQRVGQCLPRTREWLASLKHPDGGRPGVVICDRTLTNALAKSGDLRMRNRSPWNSPKRWIDAVGKEIAILGHDGVVVAHPVVVQRIAAYRSVVSEAIPKLTLLARLTRSRSDPGISHG